MNIKTACISNIGGRSNNDDTVALHQEGNCTRIFVGDGLGGYAGGQMASEAAAKAAIARSLEGYPLLETRMRQVAYDANQAVLKLQQEKRGNMKTTMVFLVLEDRQARWTHVGDSRLYHFRNGKIHGMTMDHSVSQMAVLMGEITHEQIRFHEDRNRVLRALGGDNAKADLSPMVTLTEGVDAFLLCTDGFWEYVTEKEMEQTLQAAADPQQWLDAMLAIHSKRTPSDNDNFTAAAVMC